MAINNIRLFRECLNLIKNDFLNTQTMYSHKRKEMLLFELLFSSENINPPM